ncbi:MAG: 7,8-didemethyl-8-hydroxy-5-deazariboflavin synthase CofG [Myxococcales bacterium]|nr:7,8-didemethyl-8-hydroxy-5-deazariboflavin synthase CofG [Myxococcales bacterium]
MDLQVLARAARGEPLADGEALAMAEARGAGLQAMQAAAAAARDRAFGRRITFSPKVFLPLTNLCRNRCSYCSFRRSPGDAGEWTMSPREVESAVVRAQAEGCGEALFCLGDKPESAFGAYRRTLESFGQSSTVEYLHRSGTVALAHGLLPHTNAGLLSEGEMARLKEVNVSLGLMLECVSERLCEPGMPHHKAPDKRPQRRLAMIEAAGRLRIPFTTGILVGIGETRRERVESLLAIRRLHRLHGHIQEVIVQNFRAVAGIPMAAAPEPDDGEVAHAVAMARLILDPDVSVQSPPNLNPGAVRALAASGINDLGGISPVTPDYINPRHPWPHLEALGAECALAGFDLAARAPVYDRFLEREGFVDPGLLAHARRVRDRLAGGLPGLGVPLSVRRDPARVGGSGVATGEVHQ